MDSKIDHTATPESVWAALRELIASQKETSMQIKETGMQMKETEKLIKETGERQKETDKLIKETDKLIKETGEQIKETGERQRETDKQIKETGRQIKELKEMLGGMGNSNGLFAEEFFFNSIYNGDKKLFGEHFDDCISSSKRYHKGNRLKSEHDILLFNGKSVAIIEVKYKARKEDIQKLINRLPVFKTLYPEYKSHRIYLGLAAMAFEKDVEEDTIKEGIAIVKQVGDMVVISDENLKVF